MSDYEELKKEMHRYNRAVATKHHEIQKINDELKSIEQEKETAKTSSESNLHADYQQKYKDHLNSIIGPIDNEIAEIKKELEEEDSEFQNDFNELTEEKFFEQSINTQQLLQQLQEMSSELRSKLQELVGTRLYTNVSQNLKESKMNLDVNDLDRAIAYFNECEEKTTEMLERPDFIGDFLMKIEDSLQSFELGNFNSKGAFVFLAIALLVLFALLYKFVFPFYIVFVCVIGLFHVFRTYSVYEVLLIQKAIVDNIESIEAKMHEDAAHAAEEARATLQQEHQAKVDHLKQQLAQLAEKQANAFNASKESFCYDGSIIQTALDSKMVNLEKREADAITNKMALQKELTELSATLDEIKSKMQQVFSSKQSEFLNFEKAGDAFVLDTQFLLDIDDVTKKLTMFTFPESSSLFIYKDREEALDFIKLLNVQIRSRLHPVAYEVTYFDSVNVGQDCLFFVPESVKKGDPSERLFKIISDEATFSEVMDNYRSEIIQRQKNFRQDGNIAAYNEHMIKIESLPIPYYFMFLLNPDTSIISKLSSVTHAAGMYGIYICAFLDEVDFSALGRQSKSVIDTFDTFFVIQNGKVNSRAKDFMLTTYSDQ